MRTRAMIVTVVMAAMTGLSLTPARAELDDVHYQMTYVLARLAGYTPEQAYRVAAANLAVNYNATTEGLQMTAADFAAGKDPDAPEKQRPRWMLHAFINKLAFEQNPSGDLVELQRQKLATAAKQANSLNPGAAIHFVQDGWGHGHAFSSFADYVEAVYRTDRAAATDRIGASFIAKFIGGVARYTVRDLMDFGQQMLRGQQLELPEPAEIGQVTDQLTAANAFPPGPAKADEKLYDQWVVAMLKGAPPPTLTAAQEQTFAKLYQGPDPQAASRAANQLLRQFGMPDTIPDAVTARRQYRLDANGNVLPAMLDSYVLSGMLRVTLKSEDGKPAEPVEVLIQAPPTRLGRKEYNLAPPKKMNVPAGSDWLNLPIGQVMVGIRREGQVLKQELVTLDKRMQEVTLTVPGQGPVWVLKPGFPQINPDNTPPQVGTPAAAGFPWQESILTRLSPTLISMRVVKHTMEGKELGFTFQYSLSQAPPNELHWNQPVDINIIGQLAPGDPQGLISYLDVRAIGLRLSSDTDQGGTNAILNTLGKLGNWEATPVVSTNENIHFQPAYLQSDPVELNISLGAWKMHWEWQKQAAAPATLPPPATPTAPTPPTTQQPTTPTTPTTPTAPTTPAAPVKLGLGVKVQQGANGPEVVIGSIAADSPLAGLVEPGDVILNFDGTLVTNTDQIRQIMSQKKPGDTLVIQVRHEGEIEDLFVVLE